MPPSSTTSRPPSCSLPPRPPFRPSRPPHPHPTIPTSKPSPSNSRVIRSKERHERLPLPDSVTRLKAQLKYIDTRKITSLSPHIEPFRKIYLSLLKLQVSISNYARFHLFLELEDPEKARPGYSSFDLLSLFSTSVSTETADRREVLHIIDELLVYFKNLCYTDNDVLFSAPTGGANTNMDRSQQSASTVPVRSCPRNQSHNKE